MQATDSASVTATSAFQKPSPGVIAQRFLLQHVSGPAEQEATQNATNTCL